MILTSIHGMPRIGRNRELKTATEAYWTGQLTADQLHTIAVQLRADQWRHLANAGIDLIPSNTFSLYDQMLDTTVLFGALPERFTTGEAPSDREAGLEEYFGLARGSGGRAPLEMTKWFNTNYHYLVPELSPTTTFILAGDKPVSEWAEAAALGIPTRPVLIGPVTFLLLATASQGATRDFRTLQLLDPLLNVYAKLLAVLHRAGASWVQLDEPAFATDRSEAELAVLQRTYRQLGELTDRPQLSICTYFGPAGQALPIMADLPIEGVGLDLCRGRDDLPVLRDLGRMALTGKTLFAGVIDGRNIWANDLTGTLGLLTELSDLTGDLAVSTSCSLQHVPLDSRLENELDEGLRSWLAFADQKVDEVATLARGLRHGAPAIDTELAANRQARSSRQDSPRVHNAAVQNRLAALRGTVAGARGDYPIRQAAQVTRLGLPPLPTTTIGSFPQTEALRGARAAHRRGELSDDDYDEQIRAEIYRVVALQEDLGIDLLVHGEPERNDMVAYFAEQLTGFATTAHGWVQSYGTRYVRPPILYGDIARSAPMTVRWTRYAQSLTTKPVKGMLTGPVTLLQWSFVRDDQPAADTCRQLALAIQDEVLDLQDAGIAVIQVDEPALREGLPLRQAGQAEYLSWATDCFRLATVVARDDVQIHTHMCYADFDHILTAVDALDADVTSMEAARSAMRLPAQLANHGFTRQVGPGIYDIHSPTVPTVEQLVGLLHTATTAIPADRMWVNPDCGLKTRGYDEVIPALRNLVAAAAQLRPSYPLSNAGAKARQLRHPEKESP